MLDYLAYFFYRNSLKRFHDDKSSIDDATSRIRVLSMILLFPLVVMLAQLLSFGNLAIFLVLLISWPVPHIIYSARWTKSFYKKNIYRLRRKYDYRSKQFHTIGRTVFILTLVSVMSLAVLAGMLLKYVF